MIKVMFVNKKKVDEKEMFVGKMGKVARVIRYHFFGKKDVI